ncbi:MAG: DNA topoisomerase IB [Candidatus Nanopelagicales bacterium]
MPRLRRVDPTSNGWTRRRRGRGFAYLDHEGQRLSPEDSAQCKALVIPPAWVDVWISPHPNGHIQAVGTDEAGRRQYLYHPQWREQRDAEKFDRVLDFGRSLPAARKLAERHLALPGMPFERSLAAAFRFLDLGGLRVGGEAYEGTGLATLRRDHTSTRHGVIRLRFTGKSGKDHDLIIDDAELLAVVRTLLRRRGGGEELLAYKSDGVWRDVTSADINAYLSQIGVLGTAKDFRTWQAGLRALSQLAGADGSKRAVTQAMQAAAEHLGNTPAIAKNSYVDPRLVQAYWDGDLPDHDAEQLHEWEPALFEVLG